MTARKSAHLSAGNWVEIRSKEEILATLDADGRLDGMPFMPEMFAFCGKRFEVYKRAHKTCDTVFPVRGRRVSDSIHLSTRCDGSAHGGCQAGCLLFWKEAWLKPVPSAASAPTAAAPDLNGSRSATGCSEADVRAATQRATNDGTSQYSCQATQLPYFTTELNWWDLRQYIEDYSSGNVTLGRMLAGLMFSAYWHLINLGIGLGRPMRWIYDKVAPLWTNASFPRHTGRIPKGQPTPTEALNLQPGELVRVKSHQEILRTLNTESQNRGMSWDAELVPYCGGTYRVRDRVNRIINEQTGRMQDMKNPCIILEDVICEGRYSDCRMFCPRAIYSWWREIWLERVSPAKGEHSRTIQIESRPAAVPAERSRRSPIA